MDRIFLIINKIKLNFKWFKLELEAVCGLIVLTLFCVPKLSLASPCCGQNSSSLNVMTLRQAYNLSISQSHMESMGRVFDTNGDFFVWPKSKVRQVSITQMNLGYKLSDRWQVFGSTAYQISAYKSEDFQMNETHMMDSSLGFTYEILPEYTFSYYKPIVYMTVFANLPTGRSVFQSDVGPENIAVTGHDQWGLGLGLTLQKTITPWSVLIQLKTLRLFADSWGANSVDDFFDSSAQLILGYGLPFWGLNLNLGLTQLELSSRAVTISSQVSKSKIKSPNSRSTIVNLGLSGNITESINLALIYNDQTLLGNPKNTLLAQGFSLVMSYNGF